MLKSIYGIGKILGLIILYEIENINRFPTIYDFASLLQIGEECKGVK
ncbi:MAG: transposase [Thermodesulfobacteriota bacterium]|nr:transposase [Thermodesulfobacteriota bacterium]